MKRTPLLSALILLALCLSGCSAMQRGGLIGGLIGAGAGAGIGAAGGGVGVAIGAGAGAGAGLLTGAIAGEAYEIHRARMLEDYADVDRYSGEAKVSSKVVAKYEKQLARMEARTKMMAARYEEIVAKSYVLANSIQADGRYVQVETTKEGATQITMLSEVLFDEGRAQLREAVYPVLEEVGRVVNTEYPGYLVAIEGHTDNNELAEGSNFLSNWELSAARSLAVLHFLEKEGGVDPKRMAISGYSANRPVASNATSDGQRLNRRVVITLIPTDLPALPQDTSLDSTANSIMNDVLPPPQSGSVPIPQYEPGGSTGLNVAPAQNLPGASPQSESEMLQNLPAFPTID
ncbi:OmpA family protein [bacterium]|nr:OmpA family protein [bacterium]